MANETRDRLVELLKGAETKVTEMMSKPLALEEWLGIYADHLIANGVRILPCDVSDTVYYLDGSIIVESKVHCISFGGRYGDYKGGQIHIYDSDKDNITVKLDNFGKTVFLIKAEAEQKLKEMRKEDEGE